LYVFTGGMFNLPLFENELAPYRESSMPVFIKTLLYPKNMASYLEQKREQESKEIEDKEKGDHTDDETKPKAFI
jgi:hypothetical protein